MKESRQHIDRAKDALEQELFPLEDILEKVREVDPGEAAEILDDWENASREFIETKADIEEEALRKEVHTNEKMALMFKFWAQENLDDKLST